MLAVPGCPNTPLVQRRITAALAGRPAVVELVEVADEAEAVRRGMTGSPTVLLGGVDPFASRRRGRSRPPGHDGLPDRTA
ncbi:hypothetical protein [Streptomyces sp. NPDC005209]|uniref:hypothetical protein n=1 Tax=Streptomyces sp. NPDC005209 TaxID=3156715 RepID=UPI0033A84CB0